MIQVRLNALHNTLPDKEPPAVGITRYVSFVTPLSFSFKSSRAPQSKDLFQPSFLMPHN